VNKNGLVAGAGGVTVEAAMKTLPGNRKASGLTLFEVLVVIALVIILAAFLLPAHVGGGKSPLFTCMNHLKEIDLGLILYADDFSGNFPMRVPATNAGATAFIYSRYVFPALKNISVYRIHPANFVCPLDKNRQAATNIQTLTDLNISYFLNADASHTNNPTQTLIAGDRIFRPTVSR
jgi:hypothetical protein